MSAELAEYLRREYHEGHGHVLAAIARAGRVTPAIRRSPWTWRLAATLGRVSEALANAFARTSGS